MSDLEELKRLAQAATPGEWNTEEFTSVVSLRAGRRCLAEWLNPSEGDKADASFIAAANPAAVLALIERVEELEGMAADVKAEFDRGEWATGAGYREQVARAERAESERDAYRERVALLEGWSKATTSALTGEETTELRMAWTCEKAREMRARAEALEALARKGLEAYHSGPCCRSDSSVPPKDCVEPECREWAAALEAK